MRKLTALLFIFLATNPTESFEPVPYAVNTKKWSHVLDDHFISITVNPTDLLQGKVFGLTMNSTMAILKGLAPAYVRIGSADTSKYTFKKSRYPNDKVKPEDEYTVTETHWMVFNEVLQSAGLNVVVCLNAAHRIEGTKKWDSRNSLELISFSDSQGYNLTWQLGYEVQSGEELSGIQFGKDLNRLRTILNAFPRYQNAKLIGPDIRIVHKKEDVDFWTDVLMEAGPTLDAVTWHPRWPQPSKMKVSENSDLGYEFPVDYLDWDRVQLNKILQRSIFKNAVWIGETKRESTGTFAEGLLWARRLVLAAKLGVEVVMKQPNLMDITHPKPEYWIALLHKRLLGKAVLETRSVTNHTDLSVISHCTNPYYWTDKPEKLQDGPITVYAVNMGGLEQKIQIKGTWSGRSQLLFQYVLTSGSDPDSVFSQMTYLNGEPLMMTDEGTLPDIVPKVKKLERSLTMKLPPYSIGFWVVPEAKVKICQVQPQNLPAVNVETLTPSAIHRSQQTSLKNIEDINQFIVEKLKNPESESEEVPEMKIEASSAESTERDFHLMTKENHLPRIARRIRQVKPGDEPIHNLKSIMLETQTLMAQPEELRNLNVQMKLPKATPAMEHRIYKIAEGISDAMKASTQQHEFDKFLEDAGLKQDFGNLLMAERRLNAPGVRNVQVPDADKSNGKERSRRSVNQDDEEEPNRTGNELKFGRKLKPIEDDETEKKNADGHQGQDLVIPHQPDLKGLEEKYKAILQIKLEDGKRKIDDIKKKIIQDGADIADKIKPDVEDVDLQEEIIKKEIELISKAEETVADILSSQKKRQETFEDIILEELNDAKGERINALVEMHRNHRKKENSIRKRQAQAPLTKPLMKTVEYIEKNFNLQPESVRKIKRSLEEKMGEILRNYDTKKSAEVKVGKRMTSQREERKMLRRHDADDANVTKERRTDVKSPETGRERLRERNVVRKSSGGKSGRKHHEDDEAVAGTERKTEEHTQRSRKGEETVYKSRKGEEQAYRGKKTDRKAEETGGRSRKTDEKPRKTDEQVGKVKKVSEPVTKSKKQMQEPKQMDDDDSFELFNAKKFEIPQRKPDRKAKDEKTSRLSKKIGKNREAVEYEKKRSAEDGRDESDETNGEIVSEETTDEKPQEVIPLKHDKDRRANMLKQITTMVDNMNSNEKDAGRLKRNYDEDLSNEFEPDRKSTTTIRRRPRKAEDVQVTRGETALAVERTTTNVEGDSGNKLNVSEVKNDRTDTETTAGSSGKLSKYKKLRKRPNRRLRARKDEPEMKDDSVQKKRHLVGLERPQIDLERKRILRPKLRKISPKFGRIGNELSGDKATGGLYKNNQEQPVEQPMVPQAIVEMQQQQQQQQPVIEEPQLPVMSVPEEDKNLMKDLEEIIQEQHFLGQGSEVIKDASGTSGSESSVAEEKAGIRPMETLTTEMPTTLGDADFVQLADKPETVTVPNVEAATTTTTTTAPPPTVTETDETSDVVMLTQSPPVVHSVPASDLSEELSTEGLSSEEDVSLTSDWTADDVVSRENVKDPINGSCNRKRRATYLSGHKKGDQQTQQQKKPDEDDNDDETDFSSEERIKKFKQMIYKRTANASKKQQNKNDIRSFGSGLGADEFLKMAGSTVRVVFDDVIPEAYGQTKTKIQNMGLSEYIKEFGRLVQQMRNLDQIFFNIGEAAVKGYIKGNRAEKGPYIQVISRKKRQASDEASGTVSDDEKTASVEDDGTTDDVRTEREPFRAGSEDAAAGSSRIDGRPSTDETVVAGRRRSDWSVGQPGQGILEDDQSDHKTRPAIGSEHKTGLSERLDSEQVTGSRTALLENDNAGRTSALYPDLGKMDGSDSDEYDDSSVRKNPKNQKPIKGGLFKIKKMDGNDVKALMRDTAVGEWLSSYIKDDLKQNITPWIKTTKDFIQQALTTLHRQRQLSEILARDGLHLLTEARKNVEKREVIDEPKLPVYHMIRPGAAQKKRDTDKQSEESLVRHLRGLQPGVYVVPTEEMTNVRSEQILNEQRPKSGMPNVVTLNIYYDKKSPDGPDVTEQNMEPRISQDMVTYYQNKGWNNAIGHYDQNNQYVTPVQEVPVGNAVVTPVQMAPVYRADPRLTEMPGSRLIQYPQPLYHYPPVQKVVSHPQQLYNPVVYVPPDATYVPQAPGTKRQWRDFKVTGTGSVIPTTAYNAGWNVQYGTLPMGARKSPKVKLPTPANLKMATDKKRSIGGRPTWMESAPPFWKYFATSSTEKKDTEDVETSGEESREKSDLSSGESMDAEEIFTENRKRAQEAKEGKELTRVMKKKMKKSKTNAVEASTQVENAGEKETRRKRSIDDEAEENARDRKKRSYGYDVDFEVHDILPQWFGPYQEVGNGLDDLPPHIRRSHIVSTPWSDEEEELLSTILDADDQLALIDVDDLEDDDYFFADDNALARLSRNPRSTNSLDGAMLKTNMIFKSPAENELSVKPMLTGKGNAKKLADVDSSLEIVTKINEAYGSGNPDETRQRIQQQIQQQIQQELYQQWQKKLKQDQQQQQQQQQHPPPPPPPPPQPQEPIQQQQAVAPVQNTEPPLPKIVPLQQVLQSQFLQNVTEMLPKNANDDAFYYFFKYAYDSFVKVMKSMTQLF